ncbi:unnamed protein product [Toxocara canis]|uniref:TPR_REGION domain-containing protein n=1 Tax=Toxocara canis TaxID=6265 RepID=A0A183US83_TOXCA|nr:unnamed protein product [Toxocara canis]
MSTIDWSIACNVLYHLREQFAGTAALLCDEVLKRTRDNPLVLLLDAIALIKIGKTAEAMRILNDLRNDSNVGFASLIGLRAAHTMAKNPDRDAIKDIDKEINSLWTNSSVEQAVNAARTIMLFDDAEKARSLIENAILKSPDNPQLNTLKGWLELRSGRDAKLAQKLFEGAIAQGYPDAYLGKARLLEQRLNVNEIRQTLYDLTMKNSSFLPGHIEYCRALVMGRDWDKATEQVQRIFLIQGSAQNTDASLSDLRDAIDNSEPFNHQLHFKTAQLLAALAEEGTSGALLAKVLLERAIRIERRADYLGEQVRMLVQMGDVKTARPIALEALQMETSDAQVLLGVVRCFLAEEQVPDAVAQMEFVSAAHPNAVQSELYLYLTALINRAQHKPFEEFLQNMRNAVDVHLTKLQSTPFGIDYLRLLNANFLIDVALQLFEFAPLTPQNGGDTTLKEIDRILTIVNQNCPGLNRACYLLAKAKYLSMDLIGAEKLLKSCLDRDETTAEAHLLMAQMHLQKNNFDEASRCLDVGLSFNFKVREHPLYHLIKAKVQKKSGQIDASVGTLRSAIQLPSFNAAPAKKREKLDVTDADRIAIHLELMDSLQQIGQIVEADHVMHEALARWAGKPEEQQLVLMNANLRLSRGDVDGALAVLGSVTPNQPNYQAARIRMAQIYLEEKKDKRQFAICYKQLIQHDPSPMAYVLLGDAYMSIQEPSRAIEVYESALKNNPKDDALAEKIGQAYVQCHLYSKAVSYYEAALKSGQKSVMRMRLAELLFQLGNYEKCEKVLSQALDAEECPIESSKMSEHVAYWMLLSKLHFENGNWQEAADELSKARDIQKRLIAKPPSEVTNISEQRKLAARICCQLAELHWNRREANKAIEFYKEAISLNETDVKTMTALASLYLSIGKLEACNTQCQLILNIDRHNDEATLMMADLLYQSNEADKATVHFTQLLDRNPNQYHALARCIELSWRSGDVEQAEKYLKNAVDANPRATVDAGFNYCKGLHEWYTGEPNAALQAFNRARRDLEWGERAIYNMIEICLNPDNEIIGGEVFDHADESNAYVFN